MSDKVKRETLEFQAETRQLLDLMVHSIYTNREIFLRELISNCSDAIDKVRFAALTDSSLLGDDKDFAISLEPDEKKGTLAVVDNGIGMTYQEVIDNLGTIARSGTRSFLEQLKQSGQTPDGELIGQFGVGFYSAFMVAEQVTVLTQKAGGKTGVKWESTADGSYTVEEYDKGSRGTKVILKLKPEFRGQDKDGDNFTDRQTLQGLVKKYSDYIRYPIRMAFISEKKPLDKDGKEVKDAPAAPVVEVKTLNSMVPLWAKPKTEIKREEYNQLYKEMFHDWEDPLEVLHSRLEGSVEYANLLFIPARAPFDFYNRELKSGIRLYSRNVFVMSDCSELLPDYLGFVRGLVDSPDFSLNISREILQHSKQLKTIGKNLEKAVLKALENMLKTDKPKYNKFWAEFGRAIKIGIYHDYGAREKLQELLLFHTSKSGDDAVTLADYVGRMPEKQKAIYYATGKDAASIARLPQMEGLRDRDVEVLYLYDRVDEFVIDALREYKGKKFQSISRGDLDLSDLTGDDDQRQAAEKLQESNKSLLKAIKDTLGEKVAEVRISSRLKDSAVCLVSSDQGISLSMEKIFQEMNQSFFKARRILEINPGHDLFAALNRLYELSPKSDEFRDFCFLLYDQALLIEGILPDDPVKFANQVARLMAAAK
ncbi:MAG: molecular chaperone HtpG [Negativicutes bacterium]|nr:molecular chaperone HtpG [Negativicutes bacterium]